MIPGLMADYFIGGNEGPRGTVHRAMVSLGPLSPKRYCTYKCGFCYVAGEFQQYPRRSAEDVIAWLAQRREAFDIVYVSGDTDSFARPRTSEGIHLLKGIANLDVDILFTTRYAFNADEADLLAGIAATQAERGHLFIACGSVLSLSSLPSEPKPIPSAGERLESMQLLAERGATAVLTVRPLLPDVTPSQMRELISACPPGVENVISGWYFENGQPGAVTTDSGAPSVPMYFDIAHSPAHEVRNAKAYGALEEACSEANLNLYLGSTALIEALRADGDQG
jgi:DNA repair photolyase